ARTTLAWTPMLDAARAIPAAPITIHVITRRTRWSRYARAMGSWSRACSRAASITFLRRRRTRLVSTRSGSGAPWRARMRRASATSQARALTRRVSPSGSTIGVGRYGSTAPVSSPAGSSSSASAGVSSSPEVAGVCLAGVVEAWSRRYCSMAAIPRSTSSSRGGSASMVIGAPWLTGSGGSEGLKAHHPGWGVVGLRALSGSGWLSSGPDGGPSLRDHVLEGGAGAEPRHPTGGDGDDLAGLRVATGAGLAVDGLEDAEAGEGDTLAGGHSHGDDG